MISEAENAELAVLVNSVLTWFSSPFALNSAIAIAILAASAYSWIYGDTNAALSNILEVGKVVYDVCDVIRRLKLATEGISSALEAFWGSAENKKKLKDLTTFLKMLEKILRRFQ